MQPVHQGPATPQVNAALRGRLDTLIGQYEQLSVRSREVRTQIAAVTGVAESDDRLVRAVVGPRGDLRELTLAPRATQRLGASVLAVRIVETVRAAAADAAAQTADLVAPLLPPGFRAADDASSVSALPKQPISHANFDKWWSTLGVSGPA